MTVHVVKADVPYVVRYDHVHHVYVGDAGPALPAAHFTDKSAAKVEDLMKDGIKLYFRTKAKEMRGSGCEL